MSQYPNRLHELRVRSRLTQAEVAKLLDVSMSSVAKFETGTRQPSRGEIIGLARIYKVETFELFLSPQDHSIPVEGGYQREPYNGLLPAVDQAVRAQIERADAEAGATVPA